MIQLSKKAIEDFKKIYFQEHRVELPDDEANRLGIELLEFVKLIFKPIPLDSINYKIFYGYESNGFTLFMRKNL